MQIDLIFRSYSKTKLRYTGFSWRRIRLSTKTEISKPSKPSEEKTMVVNLGFANYVTMEEVLGIVPYNQKAHKEILKVASENKKLIDATNGRMRRTVIRTKNGDVFLSSVSPETLSKRMGYRTNKRLKQIDVTDSSLQSA